MLTSQKKNCLIIFALPHTNNWENDVILKFKILYNVKYIFASSYFKKGGSELLINTINEFVTKEDINIIIFDIDFAPYIDANIIKSIKGNPFKILLTFDNIAHGKLNIIPASNCNLVFTGDPIDVLKFNEFNINSMYFPLEGSNSIYKNLQLEKDIDILFYGLIHKFGRKKIIDSLISKGFKIKIVGPPNNIVSNEILVELINRSKIVLNFSYAETNYSSFFPSAQDDILTPLLQMKGRFLQAGLCNTLCLSEYAPSITLLFNEKEIPTFKNTLECEEKLNLFLNNKLLREEVTFNLSKKVKNEFEDKALMTNVLYKINNTEDCERINIKYNIYYKRYITRFKITNAMLISPILLIKEFKYLISSKLFYYSFDFNLYLLKHLGSKYKRLFLSLLINRINK
jgi:hypothetical protein